MFHSLRSRLFLTYLLVAGLVLLLVGVSVLFLLRTPNLIAGQLEIRRLNFWMATFTNREGRLLFSVVEGRLPAVIGRIAQSASARALVLDASSEVLVDSESSPDFLPATARADMIASREAHEGRFDDQSGTEWLYVAAGLEGGRWLVLVSPQPTIRALGLWGDDVLRVLLQAGIVALIASAIFAWLIARWAAAPLKGTADAARAVAAGNYKQHLSPAGPAEAHSMAIAFNEMVARVQASRQAQRDFVANVSHELKTPLTSIQGFAQAILDGTAEDEQARLHAATVVLEESDRLRRLVEDLLDLARLDAGQVRFERETVDITALVNNVVEKLRVKAAEREVGIECSIGPLVPLIGDGDRLAQVFTNLIDNAIKHTQTGSTVKIHGELESGWISIHVDDEGTGIPEEELSRIFERFYQLDKARAGGVGRGVGLGLAISREIVQAHSGRLVAQSVVGQGSRFTVQLPVIRPGDETLVR